MFSLGFVVVVVVVVVVAVLFVCFLFGANKSYVRNISTSLSK